MLDEPVPTPEPPPPEQPTLIGGLSPDEMFARGMQSVKMTSGTQGTWQPPSVEEANRLFPNYAVLGLLGRGGMGAVYKANQTSLDRLVAIKLLPLEVSVDKDFADRFVREARAMAKLNHPNIISVHDFGKTSEGHLYFVMEYVEGANLADLIHRVGLTSEQSLAIVEQVCTALAYAHAKGIVHRDIKPANVMIDTESQVKVADFGLARLTDPTAEQYGQTMTGTVMGTPDYMAPEQMKGMNVDHRADIYSLGVMVYEMLCREVPRGAFEPPSVHTGCDPRIDPIVIKAMQPNPDRRYQSTQEMKADVVAVRTPLPVAPPSPQAAGALLPKPPKIPAKPAAPPTPETAVMKAIPPPGPAKSKTPLYAGIAAIVVVIATAAFFLFKPKSEPPANTQIDARDATGGTRSVASQTSAGEGGGKVGADGASPSTATKDTPFVNTLGMKFVPVPGTKVLFSVWDTRVQDYAAYARANKVDESWTRQRKDDVPVSQEPEYPVVGVNWNDAQAFCQWLTQSETAAGRLPQGARYRLPTDEEWSRAVGLAPEQGATPAEKSEKNGVDFPWGTAYPPPEGYLGNYADTAFHEKFPQGSWIEGHTDGFATTSPVGKSNPNRFGLFHMGGNVWQWCEDWFDASRQGRVLRGASWSDEGRRSLLSSKRASAAPTDRTNTRGFRCVLDPTPNPPAAAAEPQAIKLWDAPEKVPKTSTSHWEDEAVRIDNGSLSLDHPASRDAIIRAKIRLNTEARSPQLSLRRRTSTYYRLGVHPSENNLTLESVVANKGMVLKGWKLPRTYTPEEWLTLELRAVGDQLTVTADGNILGVIHDTSIPDAGGVMIYAGAAGYFRDVVYVPLDEPGSASNSPAATTKDAPFVNTLGMKFVPVPGTKVLFSVWDARVQDYAAYAGAKKVDDSWTRMQKDGVPVSREPEYPVVGVSWEDAQAFCQWLTDKEIAEGKLPKGMRYRLPRDEEWSWAVGLPPELGTVPAEKNGKNRADFPWGKDYPPTRKVGNYADESFHAKFPAKKDEEEKRIDNSWIEGYDDGYATTSPVGSYPANAYGLYDMGGNVWQWCEDWFDASHKERVLRGASWTLNEHDSLVSSLRGHLAPADHHAYLGFRCVLDLGPAPAPAVASKIPAGEEPWQDLLAGIKLPEDVRDNTTYELDRPGHWELREGALRLTSGRGSVVVTPATVGPNYDVQFKLTRSTRAYNASVGLPIGDHKVLWQTLSKAPCGFERIGATDIRNGPASAPNPFEDGQPHDVLLSVRTLANGDVSLRSTIDGQPSAEWTGPASQLSVHVSWSHQPKDRLCLGASGAGGDAPAEVVFSEVRFRPVQADTVSPSSGLAVPSSPVLTTATKDAPFENTLGMKFVPVPGTKVLFSVWDTRVQDYAAYSGAKKVDDAWAKQQKDGVPVGREVNHPVAGVNWDDAQAFCQWLTEKEIAEGKLPKGMKYRLPTDEEWSWAVGLPPESGTTPAEKSAKNSVDFPWGKDYPPKDKMGNYPDESFHAQFPSIKNEKENRMENQWMEGYTDGYATTSPVGAFPANAYGLYDMGGNVWQWCEDWFDASHKERVQRGASWGTANRGALLSSYRSHLASTYHSYFNGFRCVLSESAPPAATAPTPTSESSARKAAEWALGLGGSLYIRSAGRGVAVAKLADLPTGLFEILSVDFLDASKAQQEQVTDAGLALLAGLRNIETLKLNNSPVTDEGLSVLENFPNLNLLSLDGCQAVTNGTLLHLKNAASLQSLYVGKTSVNTAGLLGLREFRNLRSLGVAGSPLPSEACAAIGELQGLTRLIAYHSPQLSSDILAHLKKLPNLTDLQLSNGAPLTDADMVDIAGFTQLTTLWLPRGVGDATLAQVTKLPNLTELQIGAGGITDAGLASLKSMKKLTGLTISSKAAVTEAGIADLQKALPNLKIVRDDR